MSYRERIANLALGFIKDDSVVSFILLDPIISQF